ncbi:hypothetical protein ACFVU3_26810 [Streptomyces sp. NPDC058052]
MGDEPTWGDLLLGFALMIGVPVIIIGGMIYALVGVILWVTAPDRRWRH